MALELGLILALTHEDSAIILDQTLFQLKQTATDLDGLEVKIYASDRIPDLVAELLACLPRFEIPDGLSKPVELQKLIKVYGTCLDDQKKVLAIEQAPSIFTAAGWDAIVKYAQTLWNREDL